MRNLCLRTVQIFLLSAGVGAMVLAQSPAFSLRSSSVVDQRVESIMSQLTLDEKIDMLGGVDGFFMRDISRLNLPRLKMADGPIGVRNFGPATAMAGGISLAATGNPALAERVGNGMGRDARATGVRFRLGPGGTILSSPTHGDTL